MVLALSFAGEFNHYVMPPGSDLNCHRYGAANVHGCRRGLHAGNVNGRKSDNPVTRGWPAEDCIIAQGGTGDAPALCAYSRVRITLPI